MLCSDGGQKLLSSHVKDTSTDFSFLKHMVRSLSDCMVAPKNAELRRWSVLCLYQIKTKINSQIQRAEERKRGRKKSSKVIEGAHPYENLLSVQFSEFYATQKTYAPFEAIDYNALLEIALNKIRSPKSIEGGKVTSDAKVEPWNAPLGKDGCEIMELATRMQTMRTLERVQESVTDGYVFLSLSSIDSRNYKLEHKQVRTPDEISLEHEKSTHGEKLGKILSSYFHTRSQREGRSIGSAQGYSEQSRSGVCKTTLLLL